MRSLVFIFALMLVPSVASAQQYDFSRFQFGMTAAEARAASPDQRWTEQSFGVDLIVLRTETPVRVGRLGFTPLLAFRGGALEKIVLQAGGPIQRTEECDDLLVDTVSAVEATLGGLNSSLSPGEFGAVALARTTAGGSEVRFYNLNAGWRAGVAAQRSDRYVEVTSLSGELPSMGFGCMLEIQMRPRLADFEALPPPTAVELAAAQEIEPEWAVTDGPEVTELTMPAGALGYNGSVRVRLDCLVIADQRVNCAIESEEPEGMHFGDAAISASRFRRIAPVIDGQPTLGRRVRFTIRYELGSPP